MRSLAAVVFTVATLCLPSALADPSHPELTPALQRFGPPILWINGDSRSGVPYFVSRPRVEFSGSAPGTATAVEIVDGATTIARVETAGRRWTAIVEAMSPGAHQIRAYAIDEAGERGPPTKRHTVVISVPQILPVDETIAAGGGFQLEGLSRNGNLGISTAAVGDINGDGIEDLAVVEPNASSPEAAKGGAVYIIFGSADLTATPPDLAALTGTDGFRINGDSIGHRPLLVAPAGDFNGDGFDDFLIASAGFGAGYEDAPAWVSMIFGGSEPFPATVRLADAVPQHGIRFEGQPAQDRVMSIAGGGDINADGIADIAIGLWHSGCPTVFVGYGQAADNLQPVTLLADMGVERGFVLTNNCSVQFGQALAFAGDMNGDDIDDLAVGDPSMYNNSVSVVFGRPTRKALVTDVSKMGLTTGFQIVDNGAGIGIGDTLSGGSDLDGDGIADLAVGADSWGAPVVLRGRNGPFPRRLYQRSLNRTEGVIFSNQSSFDRAGNEVAFGGDFDGDGNSDLVISAEEYRRTWKKWGPRGSSIFVVYGRGKLFPSFNPVEGLVPETGLRVDIPLQDGYFVRPVATADLNGDGFDDVIISSPFAQRSRKGSGLVHVVFGRPRGVTN